VIDATNSGLTGRGMKRMRTYIREARRKKKTTKRQQKQERMKIGVPPGISTSLLIRRTFAPPREPRKRGVKFSE